MHAPVLTIPKVSHIGSLDPQDRGRHARSSLEAFCLSVSLHPEEWAQIARISGPTWTLERDGAKWLDALALSEAQLAEISDWAISAGLAAKKPVWKAWRFDDESDEWGYFLCATKEEALGWIGEDDDLEGPGADPDARHESIEEIEGIILSPGAMSRLERWHSALDGV